MNLKSALIERIKKESPLSVYLRDYCNITNTKLFEINQEYINFLLRYDKGFYKDIESFINHSNSFLIDSLLNLKLLSPSHLEKIYLSKLNLKHGYLGHKGYFFFNDPIFNFNFITHIFDEIQKIKSQEELLESYVIEEYKEILGKDKLEPIRSQIEFDFLKQNNLLDSDSKTQKEVLSQQENVLKKKMKEYLLKEYSLDIKTKILDKWGYDFLEKNISEKKSIFLEINKIRESDPFWKIENIQNKINKLENITLKNTLNKIYSNLFINTVGEFFYKEKELDVYLKNKIKEEKNKEKRKKLEEIKNKIENQIKKNKEDYKLFEKLLEKIEEKEYLLLNLFEYLNFNFIRKGNKKNEGFNINEYSLFFDETKFSKFFVIGEEKIDSLDIYDDYLMNKILLEEPEVYKNFYNKKNFYQKNIGRIKGEGKKELENIIKDLFSLIKKDNDFSFLNSINSLFLSFSKFDEKNILDSLFLLNLNLENNQKELNELFFQKNKEGTSYSEIIEKDFFLTKYKILLGNYKTWNLPNSKFNLLLRNYFEKKGINFSLDIKEYNKNIKILKKGNFLEDFYKLSPLLKETELLKKSPVDIEELYLVLLLVNKYKEIFNLENEKNKVIKKIKEIKEKNSLLLDSIYLDFLENEKILKEHNSLIFNSIIENKKINTLINAFFLKDKEHENLVKSYVSFYLKNYIYEQSPKINLFTNLLDVKFNEVLLKKDKIEKLNLFLLGLDQTNFLEEKSIVNVKKEEGVEKSEKIEEAYKKINEKFERKNVFFQKLIEGKLEKNIEYALYSYLGEKVKEKEKRIIKIIDYSKQAFGAVASKIGKIDFLTPRSIKNLNKVLNFIDQAEQIELLYLIYHIVYSNVVIEKGENFLTITINNRTFVILSRVDINTINNSMLFIQDRYPKNEHIFVFVNTDIFYFIFDKINTKLNIFGITVLSRNILSYMYYHKKVSDLDFYGSKEKNLSRIKMRINGTYKHIKWQNGGQDQFIFTFNELENFISDMFSLGATIGDTAVEDPVFTIGGVKMRTSIMRDGDNISISIRKTEHTATLYSKLKGEELNKKLTDLYGLAPCIYKIFVPPAEVTLEMSYSPKDVELMKAYAEQDRGIFLIIGKTRSGKSTSVRNLLDYIYDMNLGKGKEVKIVTLEDPIESKNINYNQIQVKSDPKAFQQMIKGIKRQDPDLLLVGEIRDSSTLLQTNELANMMSTFSTMHITNPLDGLFTLKGYAVQNNIDLMDIINVLKIIVSQKLLNKTNYKKVKETIAKFTEEKEIEDNNGNIIIKKEINYERLEEEGIFLYKTKEEIEIFLKYVASDWLNSILSRASGDENITVEEKIEEAIEDFEKGGKEEKEELPKVEKTELDKEYDLIMKKYKSNSISEDDKKFIEGFLLFAEKTWDLYYKQGYLVKDLHEKFTIPKLYYDYLHNKFLNANLDLVLKLSDKDTPIKLVKSLFVDSFELKEEKALKDYFEGEIPFFGEGLNKLDTQFYPYILKKMIKNK